MQVLQIGWASFKSPCVLGKQVIDLDSVLNKERQAESWEKQQNRSP